MKDNLYMVCCHETLYYFSSNMSERTCKVGNKRYNRILKILTKLNEAGTTEDNCFNYRSIVCNPFCNFVRLTDSELSEYRSYFDINKITFTMLE